MAELFKTELVITGKNSSKFDEYQKDPYAGENEFTRDIARQARELAKHKGNF